MIAPMLAAILLPPLAFGVVLVWHYRKGLLLWPFLIAAPRPDYAAIANLEHDLGFVALGEHGNDCSRCVTHRDNQWRRDQAEHLRQLMTPALAARMRKVPVHVYGRAEPRWVDVPEYDPPAEQETL